jgi:chemotaxis signal transduction protein
MPRLVRDKNVSAHAGGAAAPDELESADSKSQLLSLLLFEVGESQYAIGADNTEGVVDCPRVTPLPSAPEGVAGLTSVRGRMTVVMDLGGANQELARRRLILVKGDAQLGLLADRVEGVVALEQRKVRPVAHGKDKLTNERAKFGRLAKTYFKSGTRRVPIIDVERLCEA